MDEDDLKSAYMSVIFRSAIFRTIHRIFKEKINIFWGKISHQRAQFKISTGFFPKQNFPLPRDARISATVTR